MSIRRMILLGAAAALTAACSKPDLLVVSSDAPDASATQHVSATGTTESTAPHGNEGRYIARCTTEADGDGSPGDTVFTDGSTGYTDYCLRRYYIGVQPTPGSVYVPDNQSNSRERGATERHGGPMSQRPQHAQQRPGMVSAAGDQGPRDNLGAAVDTGNRNPAENEPGRQPNNGATTALDELQQLPGVILNGQRPNTPQPSRPGGTTPAQDESTVQPQNPGVRPVPPLPQRPNPGPPVGTQPQPSPAQSTGTPSAPANGDVSGMTPQPKHPVQPFPLPVGSLVLPSLGDLSASLFPPPPSVAGGR